MKKNCVYKKLPSKFAVDVTDKPLQEYPRPQFARERYINLNGLWQYAVTKTEETPQIYDGEILVPFSPESILSRVERQLAPSEYLHYKTEFTLPDNFNKGRVLLNFGAVDSIARIYLNGMFLAEHVGGYNAFCVDVTPSLKDKENTLCVCVRDLSNSSYYTAGKQSLTRGGMWYSVQSGIWQTVWLESVPTDYLKSVKMTPCFDDNAIKIGFDKVGIIDNVSVAVSIKGKEIARVQTSESEIYIPLGQIYPWTPEAPDLYDVVFSYNGDEIKSYFAMRKHSVEIVDGVPRIMLNNKPYFHNGVLDQGYWSDGLYTAPSDEALVYDIQTMKDMGFNMLRKHIKVEPMRWYYHCDRLGMLVWQDMPSGGTKQNIWLTLRLPFLLKWQNMSDRNFKRFSRAKEESRRLFENELREMVEQLYNSPCVACWVVFNEGWGQFDSARISKEVKQWDGTRLVDHASGWHDQKAGDLLSLHIYFRKLYAPKKDKLNRAYVLSEFGGKTLGIAEHSFNQSAVYGYGQCKNKTELTESICMLYENELLPLLPKGLCAAVYTQVSDVEDEVNGLLTYDREIVKVTGEKLKKTNGRIKL